MSAAQEIALGTPGANLLGTGGGSNNENLKPFEKGKRPVGRPPGAPRLVTFWANFYLSEWWSLGSTDPSYQAYGAVGSGGA